MIDKQKQAAALLFNGVSVHAAAATLGVHRCTVWRWRKSKAFRKEWSRLRRRQQLQFRRSIAREKRQLQKRLDALNIDLAELEKKLYSAADNVQGGDIQRLNAAFKRWESVLFEAEKVDFLIHFIDR